MIGDRALAPDVLETRELIGKDQRDEVLGILALKLGWPAPATLAARNGERRGRHPAPARREERCVQQRLDEHAAHRARMQIARYVQQIEAVGRTEREQQAVFQRGGLQLEIELATEALAQCEPEGAVDARPERAVDD